MLPIKKKEAKNPLLNEVEKPKIPALTGLEGQGKTLFASEVLLQSLGIEKPIDQRSWDWSEWSQALKGFIPKLPKPLQEAAFFSLRFLESEVKDSELLSAIRGVNGLTNFVDFLVHLGLNSVEDLYPLLNFVGDFYHYMVEESCWAFSSLEAEELAEFLTSSKEEVINDFVIPHYKIPKSNSLDLSGLFDDAFRKGINRLTFGEIPHYHWVFDPIRQSFSTSDFVGVFEYVLEGQDLQELESSTTLTESEIRFLLDLNCRDLDGIHQRFGGWPSDFVGEVLYLQETYGFCLGDFLKSPRFTEGEERLKTPFEISDFLESFQPLAPSYYEGEVGHGSPIGDWKALLNFALATLSRREQWTKAVLLEEETFEDY